MIGIEEFDRELVEAFARPNRVMAPFRYIGGKGHLVRWILKYIPIEGVRIYVEPFAGAASVFWHLKRPFPVEVLNDLDGRIVNLFRILQDGEKFKELFHRLIYTPYSLVEFRRAIEIMGSSEGCSDIDLAWAFFVCQNQGFGGQGGASAGEWGRDLAKNICVGSWRSRLRTLSFWHNRLMGVQIDNRDAIEVIRYWDSAETLFYIDPPYIQGARKSKRLYAYEADDAFYENLVDSLLEIKGNAVLSGYAHDIYKPLEVAGWRRVDRETSCHAAGRGRGSKIRGKGSAMRLAKRVESLWIKEVKKSRELSLKLE